MTNIKAISIPEPCHQSWQDMTEANNGRHCAHCCKTVVDFTSMSNEEIIANLSNSTHVCGRFGQQQLGSLNYGLYAKNLPKASWWKRAVVFVGMFGPFLSHKAYTQAKPVVENAGDTNYDGTSNGATKGKIAVNCVITVSGTIVAHDDGLPIPGVIVKLKGTTIQVLANADGKFMINVPRSGASLTITYVGYQPQTVAVPANLDKPLNIAMAMYPSMLGDVVIVKTPPRFEKCWRRIKGILGVHSELAINSNDMRSPNF